MVIKDVQFAVLIEHATNLANQKLVSYLKERFPSRFCEEDADAIISFIQKNRSEAKRFDIRREDNVATFVEFVVMFGDGFYRQEWARDVWVNHELHAPDKIALLRSIVQEHDISL